MDVFTASLRNMRRAGSGTGHTPLTHSRNDQASFRIGFTADPLAESSNAWFI